MSEEKETESKEDERELMKRAAKKLTQAQKLDDQAKGSRNYDLLGSYLNQAKRSFKNENYMQSIGQIEDFTWRYNLLQSVGAFDAPTDVERLKEALGTPTPTEERPEFENVKGWVKCPNCGVEFTDNLVENNACPFCYTSFSGGM